MMHWISSGRSTLTDEPRPVHVPLPEGRQGYSQAVPPGPATSPPVPAWRVIRGEHSGQPATKNNVRLISTSSAGLSGRGGIAGVWGLLQRAHTGKRQHFHPPGAGGLRGARQAGWRITPPDYVSHRPGVQLNGEHGLWCAGARCAISPRPSGGGGAHRQRVDAGGGYPAAGGRGTAGLQRRGELAALVCACAPEIARSGSRWNITVVRRLPPQGGPSVHIHAWWCSPPIKEATSPNRGIQQVKSAFRRIFNRICSTSTNRKPEYRDALGRDAERTMAS